MNDNRESYHTASDLTKWIVEAARLYWENCKDCPEKTEWEAWYKKWRGEHD